MGREQAMLRSITPTLVFAFPFFTFARNAQQPAQPPRDENLNSAGDMQQVKARSPEHYKAIQGIVGELSRNPYATDPRLIQSSFHAKDVSYGMTLLTSYPPKKNIAFTLGETRYEG